MVSAISEDGLVTDRVGARQTHPAITATVSCAGEFGGEDYQAQAHGAWSIDPQGVGPGTSGLALGEESEANAHPFWGSPGG